MSLDHNGEPGELQVSWKSEAPEFFADYMMFMIRYSSTSLGQKIKEVHMNICSFKCIFLMLLKALIYSINSGVSSELGYITQSFKLVFSHQAREGDTLDSVVPGEVTELQVRAKCAISPAAGHWSRWSEPVRAVVPQSSGVEKNICTPAAGRGALHRCDPLNVLGLLFR